MFLTPGFIVAAAVIAAASGRNAAMLEAQVRNYQHGGNHGPDVKLGQPFVLNRPVVGLSTMARISPSSIGATPYERVMGHAPHVLEQWTKLEDVFFSRSVLPADLLEQVRRTLALGHGCEYCMTKGGPPELKHEAMRTSLAVGLAQLFAADHRDIDEAQLAIMREHFSEPELVELIAFMGFMWAGGTFGKVFGIQPIQVPVASIQS